MAVEADEPLIGLNSPDPPSDRRVSLKLASAEELADRWDEGGARSLFRQPLPDGRVGLALAEHPELGYRMFAHPYGHWLIGADGRSVLTAPPASLERWLWERFLVSQVLPFAALLQGIEGFHASGFVMDGEVVAIMGTSGAGKSSVGLNVVLGGQALFTDDVLAVEARDAQAVCHPGPGMANVRDEELRSSVEHGRLGRIVGRGSQTLRVQLERCPGSLPLGAVYFLDRSGPKQDAPAFEPTVDPRLLLAGTFNFVLRTPDRLAIQLDTCARIADAARMFRVVSPRTVRAAALAEAIADHSRR
jgi:hypothetical protein